MASCPSCGQESASAAAYCSACGTRLALVSDGHGRERKTITAMFVDLVGFTSSAERMDPEDVAGLIAPYQSRAKREIERHGGTVEKFIGDAVVGFFGVPVVHEDDPERAVRAALAIRDVIGQESDFRVRIGVNTGEALVLLDARPERGETVATGDVVITAARLQTGASENQILVGPDTFEATQHCIEYGQRVEVEAKGKSQLIPARPARRARSRLGTSAPIAMKTELIGRDGELQMLSAALSRSRRERAAQLVTILGVPGIGKSRLVAELLRLVDQEPDLITWREGRSPSYGAEVSFSALGEIVKADLGILDSDDVADVDQKLIQSLAQLFPSEGGAERVAQHIRLLIGAATPEAVSGGLGEDAFDAWAAYLAARADRRPAVLVFEDLHWADEPMLDFVESLAGRVGHVPLVVVATARPELLSRRPTWGGGVANAMLVSLGPLGDEDSRQLLQPLLEDPPPDELLARVVERVGGNPLFVEQFARMLVERGAVHDVPATVQAVVAARLDLLPSTSKSLLQDAAVIGKMFWAGTVAALGDRDAAETKAGLRALEAQEFIRQVRTSSVDDELEYSFSHVLVRDVAYGQIPRPVRVAKHRGAAEWLAGTSARLEDKVEMIAVHYRRALRAAADAGEPIDALREPATQALLAASDRAWHLGNYTASAQSADEALGVAVDPQHRALSLFARARAVYWAEGGGLADMRQAISDLAGTGGREAAGEAAVWMSRALFHRGELDEADRYAVLALDLSSADPESATYVRAAAMRTPYALVSHDFERAVEESEALLPLAVRLDLRDAQARLLNTAGASRVRIGDLSGLDQLHKALEVANEAEAAEQLLVIYNNLADVHRRLGQLTEAEDTLRQFRRLVEHHPASHWQRWIQSDEAELALLRGNWENAQSLIDELVDQARARSPRWDTPKYLGARAFLRFGMGDLGEAAADAREAVERSGSNEVMGWPYMTLTVLLAEDHPAEAVALLSDRDAIARAATATPELLPMLACAARSLHRPELMEAPLRASPLRTPWHEAATLVLDGAAARAAADLEGFGAAGAATYVALHAGVHALSTGRKQEAKEQLRRALDLARVIGAVGWARQAEYALRSALPG